jgi:hypothetical protein
MKLTIVKTSEGYSLQDQEDDSVECSTVEDIDSFYIENEYALKEGWYGGY